jgi:hypothetical protein
MGQTPAPPLAAPTTPAWQQRLNEPVLPPVYAVEGDLCAHVDFSWLRRRLPIVTDLRSSSDEGAVLNAYTCRGIAGRNADVEQQGSFILRAEIHARADVVGQVFAQSLDGARRLGGNAFIDVPLGEAGYAYVDPLVGTVVVVYDGNLLVELRYTPFGPTPAAPAEVAALIQTVGAVMDQLRVPRTG